MVRTHTIIDFKDFLVTTRLREWIGFTDHQLISAIISHKAELNHKDLAAYWGTDKNLKMRLNLTGLKVPDLMIMVEITDDHISVKSENFPELLSWVTTKIRGKYRWAVDADGAQGAPPQLITVADIRVIMANIAVVAGIQVPD